MIILLKRNRITYIYFYSLFCCLFI